MSDLRDFLAGDRPDDVAFFLHEAAVDDVGALDEYAESIGDGVVIVVPGDAGRSAFQSATGIDPMGLAKRAMGTEGEIAADLSGGVCPAAAADGEGGDGENDGGENTDDERDDDANGEGDHTTRFVFAFAEAQNDEVGGLYAEGDVIHAYAVCSCGEAYSHKWLAGERDDGGTTA